MGNKVVYFKGVRLWENLKHWKPRPVRSGNSRKMGTSRRLGKLNSRSPNFFYEIDVHTDVKPVTALTGLGYQETFNLQMIQVQKDLIENGNSLGDLCWCQDDSEFVSVSGPPANPGSFPGAGVLPYTGSGYVPAAGDYVLLRDPASGAGFAMLLTAGGGGTLAGTFKEEVSVGWEVVLIRFFFPDCAFVTSGGWDTAQQAEDRHAFDVTYAFETADHAICKAAYVQDLT